MNVTELLNYLAAQEVKVWVEGDRLRYRGRAEVITSELRQKLVEHKAELIKLLHTWNSTNVSEYVSVRPMGRPMSAIPLSFAQQRLWFLDQLAPQNPFYNVPLAFRLVGPLYLLALECSVQELMRRHESLRTVFAISNGQPQQVVYPLSALPENLLTIVDLTGVSSTVREVISNDLARQEALQSFDLSRDLLLRTTVLRLEEQTHVLLLTLHHIACDSASGGILNHELGVLYQAFATGSPSPLTPLPIQYADFACWQRDYLQGKILESQLRYWQQQLADLPTLQLPTDFARPPVETFHGGHLMHPLSAELVMQLRTLSQQEGVTLFMTLLAAFQVLLMRYCGQEDVIVGVPIANRPQQELEGLIGFFVNTLVLRTDLSGNPSFSEVLQRVREVTLGAYEHQEVPFERLVEALRPERHLASNPLCQVLFQLHNVSHHLPVLPGLAISTFETENETAKFDLSLFCSEVGETIDCMWEYNTDLFTSATIERLHLHFQHLLEHIVKSTAQRVHHLDLLTPAQQQQMLVEWNPPTGMRASQQTLTACFDAQVERTPDAVALHFEHQQVTYRSLHQSVSHLAAHLRQRGVEPEMRVGVCLQRSVDLVIGLLAILKAGGVYVPLDPTYPLERLRFLLTDSQAQLILTQTDLQDRLGALVYSVPTLCLEEISQGPTLLASDLPSSARRADYLAYVIYTSGSTGIPKGVSLTHRNAMTLLQWAGTFFAPEERVSVLASTSICFDLSIFEIFGPLSWGGTIVLVENLLQIADLPQAGRVTLVNTVPSVLSAYLRLAALPSGVQTVNLAGEALSPKLVQQVYASGHIKQVCNLYGPSEDATYALGLRLTGEDKRVVPIGQPLGSRQAYVLDSWGLPVPIGVVGELYLAGEGLARGYWQRADLTAERFVPNPWTQEPGGRLYRTGDLVRYREDGFLEYVGRNDGQIKLRGFRIELGEIEAVLLQHPLVQQAVVVVQEESEEKRVMGYVVLEAREERAGTEQSGDAIRHWLRERLPDHMIPAQVVELSELPFTANGKVDRQALPKLAKQQHQERKVGTMLPRTPNEEILVEIWKQVLQVEQVGVQENFFALGGHSLLATQVIARLQTILQRNVPLRALFEYPTIAELARVLERTQASIVRPGLYLRERKGELPLSFAQQRLWFLDQLAPSNPFYNMPLALHLAGPLQVRALEHSLEDLLRRHESLHSIFVMFDGQPQQVILSLDAAPGRLLPIVDLTDLSLAEQNQVSRHLAGQEAQLPFDLCHDLMLRSYMLRLNKQEHLLLLTLHHIACDGWSLGIFNHELSVLYSAFIAERPSPLTPLPIQYADFACWQRDWLQDEVLEQQLTYWQQQLVDLPTLNLHTDFARPQVETFQGAYVIQQLPASLLVQLKKLSQQEGVTLFMTLLAAFQILLMRYSGQEDIVVGVPVANRTKEELEGLIGFFVNTLVLRTDFSGDPTFQQILVRVREVTLGAYTHQDLPFERLVEALQPERNLAYNPLCQVAFQLQNAPQRPLTLPGLVVEQRWENSQTAKFDLGLICVEEEGGLLCRWEYSTDLFAATTIERMSCHFENLLTALLAEPGQRVHQLDLLTPTELLQMLVEWNATEQEYPQEEYFHQRFEAQAQYKPDAVALVFQQEHLTYSILNQRANQLAHYLQGLGVGPEVLVGVGLERGPDLIVALLGILKAGGAYLPLDPTYPLQRLAFMLEDAQVSILLTHTTLQEQFSSKTARVLLLDADWPLIAQELTSTPRSELHPQSLAYVIYTSGSTGQPKGVPVPHSGLSNLAQTLQSFFNVQSDTRILQFASPSFDASFSEMVMALFWGGCLVQVSRAALMPGNSLEQVLQTNGISIAVLPPTALTTLAPERLPKLRMIVSTGEECFESLAAQWSQDRAFYNGYGPTENTVCTTMSRVGIYADKLTIGRPIANVQVYILDQSQRLVPLGVPGELCIGGAGLARGYLHRPELTAQRFIPHPFSAQAGARLYKSGDLACYRPDGSIEFLGRIDEQVKLRGFRIELGEIEAVLTQHPQVREATVLLWQEQENKRLVAYVVPDLSEREKLEGGSQRAKQDTEGQSGKQEKEQVIRWQELYAQAYQELALEGDPTFNIRGWNSSYTGQPIPEAEMRSWLDDTVSSIQRLRPQRVLEIGCGTGMLLFALAPDCIRYDASDFSGQSLAYVQRVIDQEPTRYSSVQLWQRLADDFGNWEQGSYDLVILNSVVQYFPNASYLLRVLQGTLRLLVPGGVLFVGDVRSLPLLEHFQLAVQLAQGAASLSWRQVRQRVQRGNQLEEELLVDPALFVALAKHEERIGQVHILPKKGIYHNELTQFRYQVLIRVREQNPERSEEQPWSLCWRDWNAQSWKLEELRWVLQQEQPDIIGVSHIPNARLQYLLPTRRWLWQEQEPLLERTLGTWRERLGEQKKSGIELAELAELAAELGYEMRVSWARQAEEGNYDVILIQRKRPTGISEQQIVQAFPLPDIDENSPWQTYTNQPLQGQQMRQLVSVLRSYLQERLPDYMVPAHLIVLNHLPLTANGKIDRRAFPVPEGEALGQGVAYVPPRTVVEQSLAEIWMEVLGLSQVGIHDDFFALGGHSLLVTQVIARIQNAWQIDVPLRTLFENPTVGTLSKKLIDYEAVPGQIEMITRLYKEIDQMSHEEIKAVLGAKHD